MSKSIRRKSYKRGVWAERFAAFYLMLKGYKILEMRYKTPIGEIDIIAKKKNQIVITEVKARAALTDALEAVGARSQRRIENATRHFLAMNPQYVRFDVCFDVIALQFRFPFLLRHLDNAWQARS